MSILTTMRSCWGTATCFYICPINKLTAFTICSWTKLVVFCNSHMTLSAIQSTSILNLLVLVDATEPERWLSRPSKNIHQPLHLRVQDTSLHSVTCAWKLIVSLQRLNTTIRKKICINRNRRPI